MMYRQAISIHVPREGHDAKKEILDKQMKISIHVPREGHDPDMVLDVVEGRNFYPRAP